MLKLRRHSDSAEKRENVVTITNQTFIRLAVLTIGIIVLLYSVRKASHALVLIFVAFFLAIALNAPVHYISRYIPGKRNGSRTIATSLSFLIVVVLLGLFVASIVPPLLRQSDTLVREAPGLIREYRDQNSPVGNVIRKYHLQNEVNSLSTQVSNNIKRAGGTVIPTAVHFGNSVFSVLTVLVLTFMMLVEGPRWVGFYRDLIPDKHHNMADSLADDMYRVIKGFFNGQVLLAG
ncbi:MAG: AI-2E family transporter, partial [Candidatus Saccharimonadales bacterium]